MARYLVSVSFPMHVVVEADSEEAITDDMVVDAIFEEYGKYPSVDARNVGEFEILGDEA